jgi:hypothetical protein
MVETPRRMTESELIAKTNVGANPYTAMWALFLDALLSIRCHPARASLDYCQQLSW